MPLAVGEHLTYSGQAGTVVATTDSTDAYGRGSITYDGDTFSFRALKATVDSTDYPLVATSDAVFRVGVLQQDADPALFCLVLDDGPAPGHGRRAQSPGGTWAEAERFAATDAVVFRMCWAPKPITILKDGTPESGVWASLVFVWSTSDGLQRDSWRPEYPHPDPWSTGVLGRFATDGDGVLWDYASGSPLPILVPCGFGAQGYRGAAVDGWPGCPESERTLARLEVWYLQEHVEVSESEAATLDVASCSLTINGPAYALVAAWWEECGDKVDSALDAAGTLTVTGLAPGVYTIELGPAAESGVDGYYLPRQQVTLGAPGDSATVTFASSWTVYSHADHMAGYVHDSGLEDGTAEIYVSDQGSWVLDQVATGGFEVDFTPYTDPEHGVIIRATDGTGGGRANWTGQALYMQTCLRARLGANKSQEPPGGPSDGVSPWGAAGPHVNLNPPPAAAYLVCDQDHRRYELEEGEGGFGIRSQPLPRYLFDSSMVATACTYKAYAADGTLLSSGLALSPNEDPAWANTGGTGTEWTSTEGGGLYLTVGGKIVGNVVEASRRDLIVP